jgi:hypothetical protein
MQKRNTQFPDSLWLPGTVIPAVLVQLPILSSMEEGIHPVPDAMDMGGDLPFLSFPPIGSAVPSPIHPGPTCSGEYGLVLSTVISRMESMIVEYAD